MMLDLFFFFLELLAPYAFENLDCFVDDVLVEVVEGDARNVLCEAVERHHARRSLGGRFFPTPRGGGGGGGGGAKTYIPKNFYTKVLFKTLRPLPPQGSCAHGW
ncbi:hypothetical protein HanPI659440_Chr01g0001311 [Helianthus annuus]|nr:hypothetical protein HanPI659440_Chr01g0001311 [Helianthus annuus]